MLLQLFETTYFPTFDKQDAKSCPHKHLKSESLPPWTRQEIPLNIKPVAVTE